MRLVSFGPPGAERPGIVEGDQIVDLLAVDGTLPPTIRDILAADLVEDAGRVAAGADDDARFAMDAVRLGPPVLEPSKIICLGRNYRDHAHEQDQKPPEFPMLFSKGPNVLCGDGDDVPYPAGVEELDYEVELAFVIGRRARRVTQDSARAHVAGYGVFIDLTARDLQRRERQWFRGKSFDGAGPFGPWLVTSDEVPDPHELAISLEVNRETRQSSNTGEMNFGVDFLVHYLSRTITLEPGDIIATGTPSGVGAFRDPPVFLQRGDRISATIESIGTLECAIA